MTFESQLLELLKEYNCYKHNQNVEHCSRLICGGYTEKPITDFLDFAKWLSKRVENHTCVSDGLSYLSNPPKSKCAECGEFMSKIEDIKAYDLKELFPKTNTDVRKQILQLQNGEIDKINCFLYGVPITITLRESN